MPGCLLRVRGDFDVDTALATSPIPGCRVWHEGELNVRGQPWEHSGFSVWASRDGTLEEQAENVIGFLEEHKTRLLALVTAPGVEDAHFDFGHDCRLQQPGIAVQGDYLPARLLALCGELGLAIMLTLYPSQADS